MTPSHEHGRDGGAGRPRGATLWALALLPLVLLGALLGVLFWSSPLDVVRGEGYPPVEELAFQRVELGPEGIVATVLNDGPDPVTIAQVQVDEAYWSFTAEPRTTLAHLGRTTLTIPYPWVQGDAHALRLVTSTGVTFDHEVAVAVETPTPDARFFGIYTLIGLYVGVIPVAIGLLWLPLVSRAGRTGVDFLLALTIGLLLFLLIEAGHDGLEAASLTPSSFQGVALFVFGALAAFVGLEMVGGWLRARRRDTGASEGRGWILAQLVATGIGLHNFGEGAGDRGGLRARRGDARDGADRRVHAAQHDRGTGDRGTAGEGTGACEPAPASGRVGWRADDRRCLDGWTHLFADLVVACSWPWVRVPSRRWWCS